VECCLTQSVEQLTHCLLGLGRGIRGPQLSKQLHIAQDDRLDATRYAEECRAASTPDTRIGHSSRDISPARTATMAAAIASSSETDPPSAYTSVRAHVASTV
jgi:hypothetical protein